MATQITISPNSYIKIDDEMHLEWSELGTDWNNTWISDTIHQVIWNDLPGQNEIQNRDPSTGVMTGNTNLNSVTDAVGGTTVQGLIDWAAARKTEVEVAQLQEVEARLTARAAHIDGGGDPLLFGWDKSWYDYDPKYS